MLSKSKFGLFRLLIVLMAFPLIGAKGESCGYGVAEDVNINLDQPKVSTIVGDGEVELTWDDVENEEIYRIYYSKEKLTGDEFDNITFNDEAERETANSRVSKTITGLDNGELYYFLVVAEDVEGQISDPKSNQIEAKPNYYYKRLAEKGLLEKELDITLIAGETTDAESNPTNYTYEINQEELNTLYFFDPDLFEDRTDGAYVLKEDNSSNKITASFNDIDNSDSIELAFVEGENDKLTNIAILSSFRNKLDELIISDHNISSLKPLEGLVNLTKLHITDNDVAFKDEDLEPLLALIGLKDLDLSGNEINKTGANYLALAAIVSANNGTILPSVDVELSLDDEEQ